MKKLANHSQWKEQENFPARTNDGTDSPVYWTMSSKYRQNCNDAEGTKKAIDRKAGHCNKEIETVRSQSKLDNLVAKMNS